MNIAIVHTLPEEAWRHFVDEHPAGNVFHTPEMFQVFECTQDHQPELWAATEGERILALLLPVRITLLSGVPRLFSTRDVVYGGVLCAPGPAGEEALTRLLRTYQCEAKGYTLFTELRNLSDSNVLQPILLGNDYTYEDHLNYLIDVSLHIDQVWGNIHASARKKIKKALDKHQLDVIEIQDRSEVAIGYAIFQKTYVTAHVPLADCSLFEAAYDVLQPKGMVKFLLGRVDDKYVAASVALLYKGVIYGWYRGFDRTYSAYLPNDLMVWHILKWGAENGYRTFDFGGAGKPNERYGPRQFKAKFGGHLVNFGRSTCVHHSHLLRVSQVGYQLFRYFLRDQGQEYNDQ